MTIEAIITIYWHLLSNANSCETKRNQAECFRHIQHGEIIVNNFQNISMDAPLCWMICVGIHFYEHISRNIATKSMKIVFIENKMFQFIFHEKMKISISVLFFSLHFYSILWTKKWNILMFKTMRQIKNLPVVISHWNDSFSYKKSSNIFKKFADSIKKNFRLWKWCIIKFPLLNLHLYGFIMRKVTPIHAELNVFNHSALHSV